MRTDGANYHEMLRLKEFSVRVNFHISWKKFYLRGMDLSEWTESVRADRDIQMAAYSVPGVRAMRWVDYCPPIAVSPFLLALSVFYYKQTLWRGGQLRTYVGMGSLGMRLHRDCNVMGDAAKTCPRIPFTCAQNAILSLLSICIIPSRQMYVAIDNPSLILSISSLTTSSYRWNYVSAADNVSYAENWQSTCCQCISHLYKFRGGILVTWVFRYWGERQG